MTSEIFSEPALPASSNIARRSVSIFSRKGTDTPAPSTQALVLAGTSMPLLIPASPTGTSVKGKNKRWTLTGRVEVRPEGTILRAVPKDAPKTSMTPLEREMATSPNEEILRAIGLPPESAPTSPIGVSSPLSDISNVAPQRYYSKRGKKNQQDYLGVWRDGQVQWDKENSKREELMTRPKTSDGTRPSGVSFEAQQKLVKPKIQVIIPDNHSSRRPFSFIPFFQNTPNERPAATSPSMVSPPSVTSGLTTGSMNVSAISPPIIHKPKPQRPFQPITTLIDQSPAFDNGLLSGRPQHSRRVSVNSSSSDSEGDDSTSLAQSSRSSMTSIGVHNEEQRTEKSENLSRRGSTSSEASFKKDDDASGLEKMTGEEINTKRPTVQGPRMNDMVSLMRSQSAHSPITSGRKKRLSSSRGQKKLAGVTAKNEPKRNEENIPSLDDAVRNLEHSLSNFKYDDGADAPEVVETTMSPIPEIILSPVDAPPALPRKSSKRSRLSFPPKGLVEAPAFPPDQPEQAAPVSHRASAPPALPTSDAKFIAAMEASRLSRRRQQMQSFRRDRRESYGRLRRMSSVRSVLSLVREEDEFQHVDSNSAEEVVFHILSHLESMDDLFNAALITKGFHHIFKRHELELMRSTLLKECSPAWELREACLPMDEDEDNSAAPSPEYTPSSYFEGFKADMTTVMAIKQFIFQQCPSLLRAETTQAINRGDHSRVDAALFRIWTFCHIFGSNKGREDDLVAQMDWLRGGVLAHQESCSSTISAHDSFYISNVLLSAPEHFGKGNEGGLSAEELFDMLEMWNCLVKLTGGLIGQTQQARQFGVFDETDIAGGDIDGEEAMLEEWQAYILTLGLAPIFDIVSTLANADSHSAFAVAQYKGLTHWDAPFVGNSRTTFLHEAVSRLYEERICEAFSPERSQVKQMRSVHRARDSELRQRRLSVRSMHLPEQKTSLSREWGSFRSASGPSTSSSSRLFGSQSRQSSFPPPLPSRSVTPVVPCKSVPHAAAIRNSYFPTTESIAEELPPYDPIAEAEAERTRMHPLQAALHVEDADPSHNSAEKAVFRIVEMGFTPEEAKGALKITDMGDGLRVDRAVEYLMRSKGFS